MAAVSLPSPCSSSLFVAAPPSLLILAPPTVDWDIFALTPHPVARPCAAQKGTTPVALITSLAAVASLCGPQPDHLYERTQRSTAVACVCSVGAREMPLYLLSGINRNKSEAILIQSFSRSPSPSGSTSFSGASTRRCPLLFLLESKLAAARFLVTCASSVIPWAASPAHCRSAVAVVRTTPSYSASPRSSS